MTVAHRTTRSIDPATDEPAEWSAVPDHAIAFQVEGTCPGNVENLRARYQVQWNDSGLYVLVNVLDSDRKVETVQNDNLWQDDSVELLLSLNGIPISAGYDDRAVQIVVRADGRTLVYPDTVDERLSGRLITSARSVTSNEYQVEIGVLWPDDPLPEGTVIGFDVAVNDDDDGDRPRERRFAWSDATESSSNIYSTAGDATQMGLLRLDPPEDSSSQLQCPEGTEQAQEWCSDGCTTCRPLPRGELEFCLP